MPHRPRHPIVLLHGMGLIGHVLKRGDVFDTIVEHLRETGVAAYAPRVAPYNPTAVRAELWDAACRQVLAESGAERLNLIGFSTGGLDARYLVSRLGGHAYTASLTTIATPHRGSPLTHYVLGLPGPVLHVVLRGIKFLASRVYPDVLPAPRATLEELTLTTAPERFNADVPDHPEVTYYAFGAMAGKGAPNPVSPLLWALNRLVYRLDGVNDGFVSVRSAHWTGFQTVLQADHGQLVGLLDGLVPFDAQQFYHDIAARLARDGF